MAFLTDGRAISYAESVMGYVEGLRLGAIVGSPTAGTNGNVDTFPVAQRGMGLTDEASVAAQEAGASSLIAHLEIEDLPTVRVRNEVWFDRSVKCSMWWARRRARPRTPQGSLVDSTSVQHAVLRVKLRARTLLPEPVLPDVVAGFVPMDAHGRTEYRLHLRGFGFAGPPPLSTGG